MFLDMCAALDMDTKITFLKEYINQNFFFIL